MFTLLAFYANIVYMSDYNNINPVVNQSIEDRLMKNRIVWLKDEVNDKTANDIINRILLLHADDNKSDIYLYINSPGGSITAGTGIYDTLRFVSNDIVTLGIGMAASMGQFLLSSGTPGKRFILPNTRVLMHQPSGGISGIESDVRIEAELINDMKKTMAEITAKQTGHTVDEILKDNEYDHWYTAKEALDYGFVDYIVNNEQEMQEKLLNYKPVNNANINADKSVKKTTRKPRRKKTEPTE